MLVVVSDTHGIEDARLHGRTGTAVREAECVIHAGDFTTGAVLDSIDDATRKLHAVHGNADDPAVRARLPATRTVEYAGVRIAITHRRDGGETGLSLFGRERDATLVVSGHTHQPTVVDSEGVTLLNPGSHAQPRGNRPAHAELSPTDNGLDGELRQPDGTLIESFTVSKQ